MEYAMEFVNQKELNAIEKEIRNAKRLLESRTGAGGEYLGWMNLPRDYNREEFRRMQMAARQIRKQATLLVVIGIGGSYLGCKAVLDALSPYYRQRRRLEIVFAGQNMSSLYLSELAEYVKTKDFAINVISKSGTTTEPAIAFRIFKRLLEEKYGIDEARKRIYVTTDKTRGALRQLAEKNGYESFVIPDDIGGRYSVLTAVGLLPAAAGGVKIRELMQGAARARSECRKAKNLESDIFKYVALRNLLYRKGYIVEMQVTYEPKLATLAEWWKQLFAESEGKDEKGLFVASATFSTDLHSLGQFIQNGSKILFETVLRLDSSEKDITITEEASDVDGLNYLAGKTVSEVNDRAFAGTLLAHHEGKVPNMVFSLSRLDARVLGYLLFFFEYACGLSGYVLGVNPFNQPGVEAYKTNMFALLGKPGYEKQRQKLDKKQNG